MLCILWISDQSLVEAPFTRLFLNSWLVDSNGDVGFHLEHSVCFHYGSSIIGECSNGVGTCPWSQLEKHLQEIYPQNRSKEDFWLSQLELCSFHLEGLEFPDFFVSLIEQCISTTRSSVAINGELGWYFRGSRDLRQGDPFSLLVCLCHGGFWETAEQIIYWWQYRIPRFSFWPTCDSSHLCGWYYRYFSYGEKGLLQKITYNVDRFSSWSSPVMNKSKTELFTAWMSPI